MLSIDTTKRIEHPSATGEPEALFPGGRVPLYMIRCVNQMKAPNLVISIYVYFL